MGEQGLALSGAIGKESAPKIGKLIGVDGFIDGTATLENDRFILTLKIVETDTGEVIWAEETMSGKNQVDTPTTRPERREH